MPRRMESPRAEPRRRKKERKSNGVRDFVRETCPALIQNCRLCTSFVLIPEIGEAEDEPLEAYEI
jgi:hypothetical protein